MPTFTVDSNQANTNGTTDVELVAAPSSGSQRVVKSVVINNVDTATATVNVQFKKASNYYSIAKITMAAGDRLTLDEDDIQVLDATDESIVVDLAGAVTTNELDCVATWGEYTT